jgi:hypothetical protein
MPGVSGVTVMTNACAFYHCARGCGRAERPAFPAPSSLEGQRFHANSAEMRRGNADLCHGVIPGRSEASSHDGLQRIEIPVWCKRTIPE